MALVASVTELDRVAAEQAVGEAGAAVEGGSVGIGHADVPGGDRQCGGVDRLREGGGGAALKIPGCCVDGPDGMVSCRQRRDRERRRRTDSAAPQGRSGPQYRLPRCRTLCCRSERHRCRLCCVTVAVMVTGLP